MNARKFSRTLKARWYFKVIGELGDPGVPGPAQGVGPRVRRPTIRADIVAGPLLSAFRNCWRSGERPFWRNANGDLGDWVGSGQERRLGVESSPAAFGALLCSCGHRQKRRVPDGWLSCSYRQGGESYESVGISEL
jgi:hypothetical protein